MKRINIINEVPKESSIDREQISELLRHALAVLGKDRVEVEVWFATEKEISLLNRLYRHKSRPTDVLSFPQANFPGQKLKILGSIVICLPIVVKKREELGAVLKHGLLHLLGYDHEIKGDADKFNEYAEKIGAMS